MVLKIAYPKIKVTTFKINPNSVTAWIFFGRKFDISLKVVSILFLITEIKYSIYGSCFLFESDFLATSRSIFSASFNISSIA